jgi:cell division protease FtsH
VIFTDFTTGAGNDIERATDLARRMVCEWGMSEKLGPLAYEKREGPVFLGMQSASGRDYSDSKAQEIDAEVFRLVNGGHESAITVLKNNLQILHNMAEALLEFETIDAEEVKMLVDGASLADIEKYRGVRKEEIAKHRKIAAEQNERADRLELEKKKSGGSSDPVGNSGPVTA